MEPPVILLSINPYYSEAILSGQKTIEFRKASFPKNVGIVLLYSTSPMKKIVGWMRIKKIVTLRPVEAWKRYHKHGGITRIAFITYYSGAEKAVCLSIGEKHKLDPPIDPYEKINHFLAPQSYRYIKKTDYLGLNDKIDVLRNLKLDSFSKAIG